ncbi:MAG: SGNH/GDSL hydrolase family protein [Planctomycetes bacterium]|nr:SGNH/GDSL hydrolase family protein [Planctomycetota bacterium]
MDRILAAALALCTSICHEGAFAADPLRICALGDSYTIGEGVAADQRWPIQLAAALRAGGIAVAEPTMIARTGWTAGDLLAAIERDYPAAGDLVTLQIGVNDQFRGRGIDAFAPDFAAVLVRALALAGTPDRLLVLSIPDWGVTPFATGQDRAAIAAQIDAFNACARTRVVAAGARWIDVTTISREAARDRTLIAADGLHPSATMYARWVALLLAEGVGRAR